jgi:hypothetical protein
VEVGVEVLIPALRRVTVGVFRAWNSVLCTPNAKYTCADIGDMYLQTPMDRYEYMRIKANLVPDEFKDLYKLHDKVYNGFIYMKSS